MNNEPVAIVKKLTLGGGDNFIIERFVSLKEGTLLYTHPVKTLTDAEIVLAEINALREQVQYLQTQVYGGTTK